MSDRPVLDVLVVGAGFAGLSAARMLDRAGLKFELWEARDRVGGRVYTRRFEDGSYVDLGGQWVGPGQERLLHLSRQLGIDTFPTYNEGQNLVVLGGRRKKYSGTIPKIGILSLLNIAFVMRRLEGMAAKIDLETPWTSPRAEDLDRQTLGAFLGRHVLFRDAKQVLEAGLETLYACSPAELSLLHALFYIRSGDDLETLLNIEGGAQQWRFEGGAQPVAEGLAKSFRDSVRYERPVEQLQQEDAFVRAVSGQHSIRARRVIVAVPPALADRISYWPSLPARRAQLCQRMPMGTVIKCYAIYRRPWWRRLGLSGQVVAGTEYPLQTVFDNSPPDGKQGVLMGFSLAGRARALMDMPAEERKDIILKSLTDFFGPHAAVPEKYLDHCWAEEEWSRGCYAGMFGPGGWTQYGEALRRPCGRLHWAGTESSERWNGYIEGAILSGERAAREVIERISE